MDKDQELMGRKERCMTEWCAGTEHRHSLGQSPHMAFGIHCVLCWYSAAFTGIPAALVCFLIAGTLVAPVAVQI